MLIQPISPALRARPAPVLPVADMVVGQTPEDAAALLPRLFNLCRVAQGIAACAAFGLPLPDGWQRDLRREIIKEHVLKLCLKWPGVLGLPQITLPSDWTTNETSLRSALFGANDVPQTHGAFQVFLISEAPVASILRAITALFPDRIGSRSTLDVATPANCLCMEAKENAVPSRHANHPVLKGIEAEHGRGPLWTAVGVLYDLDACVNHTLPSAVVASGFACVPAARGLYAVQACVENNKVTAFKRVTPTDHLLARDGALDQSLARLPTDKASVLAPILLSILDPCFPVALEHNGKGVPAHA